MLFFFPLLGPLSAPKRSEGTSSLNTDPNLRLEFALEVRALREAEPKWLPPETYPAPPPTSYCRISFCCATTPFTHRFPFRHLSSSQLTFSLPPPAFFVVLPHLALRKTRKHAVWTHGRGCYFRAGTSFLSSFFFAQKLIGARSS